MIYKRGRFWHYDFEFRGQRIKLSTRQTNQRVAEQMEAAHRTRLAKGEVGIEDRQPAPTLKAFTPRFLEAVRVQKGAKTANWYAGKLRPLLSGDLAGRRLSEITEETISLYVQSRSSQRSRYGRAFQPATINRELQTLRRLLRLAHEWKIVQRCPRIRLLKGERQRDFVLSRQLEATYLAALPSPLSDVAVLLIDTGLRLGEALSLEWPQVHLEPLRGSSLGYISVAPEKAKSGKKRNVPLTPRAAEVLNRWAPKPGGLVFQNADGRALVDTSLSHAHKRVRDLLRLPADFVLHSLRHTYGTRLGEAGADAFTIMRLMGHSSVTVSQRYVHPTPETLERAVVRMAAVEAPRIEVPPNSPPVPGQSGGVVQ